MGPSPWANDARLLGILAASTRRMGFPSATVPSSVVHRQHPSRSPSIHLKQPHFHIVLANDGFRWCVLEVLRGHKLTGMTGFGLEDFEVVRCSLDCCCCLLGCGSCRADFQNAGLSATLAIHYLYNNYLCLFYGHCSVYQVPNR